MQTNLRLFAIAILSTATLAWADAPPPAQGQPLSKCADLARRLGDLYTALYNVDTRPLAIDSYRVYRDSIQTLRDDTTELSQLCDNGDAAPKAQTLYKSRDLRWTTGVSYQNVCATADFTNAESEFQETSIRECLRDGYSGCDVKSRPRVFAISGSQNQDVTWTCTAKMDLVLNATK